MIVIVDSQRPKPAKSIQMPREKRINMISLDDFSTCTLPLTTSSASIILKENR